MKFTELEEKFGLTCPEAARLIGIDRRRYYEFRNGTREAPPYIMASIKAHAELTPKKIDKFLAEAVS